MTDEIEAALLARCRHGDGTAWSELFDRHYAAAGRFVFQLHPQFSREDVDEICQETFLAVIKNLETFAGHCQFQTWLFRIAANKAKDYCARQLAAKRGGGQSLISLDGEREEGSGADIASSIPAPDAQLLSSERMLLLRQALDQLGDPCREIIELRYFGELSYEELAFSLHLNQKTVSSRLSKCLDRLEPIVQGLFFQEKNSRSFVQS